MGAIQESVYFVIFLGVLVTVHELGHFLAAKWAGVKVLKFSIGFGPKVLGFRRGETEYQVAALPLGGFVQMAGQHPGDEVDPAEAGRSFQSAPWWKRMVILSAGPGFNFIFPVFVYFFVFLGDQQATTPRVGWVEPGLPAAAAGMQPGDLVTGVDGKPIRAFEEIRPALEGVFERPVVVTVQRAGRELALQITPRKNVESTQVEKIQRGLLGISPWARPSIVGVLEGSPAHAAGLRTFDRVLNVNGQVVKDELQLARLLEAAAGPLVVQVVRSEVADVGGAGLVNPRLLTFTLEARPQGGAGALGVESADLYAWTVFPDSPAARAGVKPGDRLLAVNGTPLSSWFSLQLQLKAAERSPFELSWRSGGELKTRSLSQVQEEVLDELKNKSEVLELGLRPRAAFLGTEVLAAGPEVEHVIIHRGPGEALVAAARTVPEAIRSIALVMGKLFTRDLPLEQVGGPILLFQVAARSAEAGVETFLRNMALVSVNLGLVNLLPIPILDGFGLLAAAWEGIRRRPIPEGARDLAYKIGFAMLAVLMVLVFKNDITKLLR
jgi:regulator of sigma E protease